MTDALANVLHRFSGPANCVWCLAHIVNLVAKIILHQFDALKRPASDDNKHDNNMDSHSLNTEPTDRELAELMRHAEKEEKEMDNGGNEEDTDLEEDFEEIQAAMREEIGSARMSMQPVCCILYKVSGHPQRCDIHHSLII
jgi:predicted transcriptional regulator